METQVKEIIDTLNNLVEINNDRIEGYETASKETEESDLKSLFGELINTSQQCRRELVLELRKLGGEPIKGTTVSGKFFRAWMDVKAAITNKNRKLILDSCEFGEDVALKTYDAELNGNNNHMTTEQRQMINEQYLLIKKDHDRIKHLRDGLSHN